MFCTTCGQQIESSHQFCPQCGSPTNANARKTTWQARPGRRLVRSIRGKSIAGVCAGFADYLDVDVTLMRIVWLCTAIFTGIGFVAYLVCWIVMPPDYGPAPTTTGPSRSAESPKTTKADETDGAQSPSAEA